MINGIYYHEIGCPDAWKSQIRECKWCGRDFRPEYAEQMCCDGNCDEAYNS